MSEIRTVPLDRIVADPRLQSRAALNRETVADYAEHYRDGVDMPPVIVFLDDKGNHWLADGFHRVAAAKEAGLAEIPADLHNGDFRDALLHAAGANAAHGLRRSNADKRRAVEMLLSDPECREKSDREVARLCGVTADLVGVVRSLSKVDSDVPRKAVYRNKHGGISTMNVANIGKGRRKAPAPPPAAPPAPPVMELPDLHEPPRPCPFCLKTEIRLGFDDGTGTHRVFCVACTAIGPGGDTEERAVFEWNCRQ